MIYAISLRNIFQLIDKIKKYLHEREMHIQLNYVLQMKKTLMWIRLQAEMQDRYKAKRYFLTISA